MTAHRRLRGRWAAVCAGALAGVALTACGDEGGSGAVIEGEGWRGALLESRHDAMTLPDGTTVDAASSVPEREDVEVFEEELPPVEQFEYGADGPETIELDEGYFRQYTELSGDGHRQLVVQGLCEDFVSEPGMPEVDAPEWTTEWATVADGGSCFWNAFWNASMDLASGEIISFAFNGMG